VDIEKYPTLHKSLTECEGMSKDSILSKKEYINLAIDQFSTFLKELPSGNNVSNTFMAMNSWIKHY
jgi:hypothetical protein